MRRAAHCWTALWWMPRGRPGRKSGTAARWPHCSAGTDGRVCGAAILDGDGQTVEVMADLVVGADGIGSTVARLAGARVLWEGRHATAVVYGHCRGLRAAAYSW